ncbi:MAG: hypothetical protein WA063_00045 [Minisyncoccia bacterium]
MKIKVSRLLIISLGIMIAGLAILVYGKLAGIGNERMIWKSMIAIVCVIVSFFFAYLYKRSKPCWK